MNSVLARTWLLHALCPGSPLLGLAASLRVDVQHGLRVAAQVEGVRVAREQVRGVHAHGAELQQRRDLGVRRSGGCAVSLAHRLKQTQKC